ncbi:uncharacterized protein LOC141527798 isoform X1 [Cotesia typhae]|uniref:uncharacterized protein LOC141527798 isoform X1 n=1 Tax=Cotesia typhae TaxID=2053667 RepID=UPI003D69E0F4
MIQLPIKKEKKMMSYLQFYDMKNNVKDNIREIFSRNRLFTDSLLTNIIWVGKKGQSSEKIAIMRRRISHDLSRVLKRMYPEMTHGEFRQAVSKALNAANARFREKRNVKKATHSNSGPRNTANEEDLFESEWTSMEEDHNNDNKENGYPADDPR